MKPEVEENLPQGNVTKMTDIGSLSTEHFVEFLKHLHHYKGFYYNP